jgi:phosphoglycolate phosphatase-like HAD superfamily hydrolase
MTDTRTGMEGLLQQRLGVAEQKQAIIDKARRKKEAQFNPLSLDNIEHVDGDTFRLKDSNQLVRLGGADTFESQEWVYENNPEREQAHKRALSKLTGTPAFMISREDLLERGKAQANETKLRISQLGAEGNLGYKQTGVDVHGRQLGELADLRTGENPFADYAGREHNANYRSKFNAEQRIRDLFTGERGEHERFTGPRPWLDTLKDQPVNLVHGAGQMLNDLAQAGTVLAKAGSAPSAGTTAMFDRNRDRLEYFKERFLSPQAKARNRLAQKNATRARQVYNTNYQAYLNAGDSENEAKLKAGISEFGDTIKRLVANPGQILDSTVESLPYMMGVGAVGRAVTTKAATALSKKVAKEAIEAGATVQQAALSAAKWQASKEGRKAIGKFSTSSGVATVGVTEGLSNSADVYASVAGMTEEEAMQSEQYLALREKGLEHGEAVRELATDAFHNTFVKNMALAAAASFATGAGNWEARLFTTKADKLKKAVTPKAPAKSLTRAVGRGVAKVGKAVGPAGVKEAAEEAIQSGGGEFLAQLAKFEATGEEVGPGIGAATAEGAVVGFASGAGISGTLGTLKDIGAADLKKLAAQNPFKGKQGAEAAQAAVAAAVDGTDIPTPEGQPAPAAAPTPVNETPVKTLDDMDFDTEFKNVVANSNRGPIVLYEELNTLSKIARGREKPISAEHQQQLEAYKMLAQEALSDEVTTISGKSSEEINDRDLTILSMAAEMGVDISTDNLSADQKTVIEETVKLAEDLEKVADLTEKQLKLATTEKEKRNIREVAENKFGDLKEGANGRPGLRYYDRRMRELMNTSRYGQDNQEMESLGSGLKAFAESQNDYLDDARAAVRLGKSVGRFIYTAPSKTNKGGSPAMVKILEREQEKFNAIVGSLRDRYEAWQRASKAGPRIQAPGGAATGSAKDERARQEDEAARRKAGKENVPDKPLRKALENVLKATKVGSRLRTQKLISLMKKARKSKDIYLVGMVSKATNDNDTARRKLQKGSKEEQPESQRDAQGKPKFDQPLPDLEELSATEILTTGETRLERPPAAFIRETAKKMVAWVKQHANKGVDALLKLSDADKPSFLDAYRHSYIYRYGWVIPSQKMVNDISDYIGDRPVVMPAAGLGFMARLLKEKGHDVQASDTRVAPQVWTDVQKQDAVEAARNAPENSVLFVQYPEMAGDAFMADVIKAFNGEEIIVQGIESGSGFEANLTLNPKAQKLLNKQEATKVTNIVDDQSDSFYVETYAFDMRKENTGKPHFPIKEMNANELVLFAENIIPGGFNATPISGIVGEQGETTETTETAETTETTETPVKETLRTAAAKGTQAVLGFINQSSKLEAVRLVSERLREVLGDRDVEIVELTGDEMLAKFGNAKAKGAYYQGKIYLNTGALTTPTNYLHTVMHEATHAALDGAIKKGLSPELQKRVKDLRFEIIKALTMDGSSQANDMIRFIAKEPEEMLAHALNTPWFRNFLQELQLGEVSAWDKFVQLIADILGISNKSALGEVLDLTESIFQEIAPKKEAAPKITFKEAKDTSKIVPWTREGIEKMFSNSKALERLTDAKLVQLQENIEKAFTVSTGDDTSLDEAGFRYQQAIEQELHSREAEQTIARVAKSLKIPKSFIDLTARVTGAERDTNRRVTDPVTGESFTAIELMDQLEDEGLPRMGPEFQARRGYTEAEIKEYRAWQAAQAQLIERGIAENDLMYLIGIIDGSLSLPSEEAITRVEAEAQREGPAPASAGVGTETGAEAGTGVELNPAVTPAEPEISPEEAAQAAREEAEKLDKAVRLAEARQLRTLVSAGKVNPDSLYVSNTEDQAFLNRIMPDVPALQAIEQLIDHIEPNPDLQNVPIEPTLPSEVLQTVIEQGAILNTPNNKKTIPARSIPEQMRHLANTAWDKLGKFQRELHAARLGPTLSDMFKIKRSKVKDLLASNNFIMQTLRDPGSLQKFIEEIGATPAEALALRTFADFYGAFSKTLYGGMDRLSTINSINQVEHVPIYFLQNDKGVFDPNVAGAMALEAMQWIMSDGAQAMFNSAEDIRAILGLPPNAPITGQMWQQVGRGTLQTNVAQQIGFKILSHLNLEAKPGGRALYTESMAASLGAQVMATLIDMGNLTPNSQARIRRHSVSAAAWEQMTGVKPPHSVMMVSNDFNEIRDPNNPQEWKKVDVNAEFRNRVVPGRAIFNRLFASTSNVRTPRFQTMTLADVPKMVSRTISKIPEVMRERMLHDANKHYTTSPSVMGLLEKFEDPEQFLTMAHAYQSEADIARLHQQDRDKAISRNRGLWSDLTEAMDWHKRHGTKKFYLPVRMGGNGRVIQDSNVINPQNSKLHRFMFIREGWQKAITKKAPSDMNDAERMRYNGLMMAIGLGMGLKTDSMLIGEVVSEVEKRMEEDGIWKDALDVLDTEKKFFDKKQRDKLAKVLSEQGTHTLAALHALNNWRNAEDGAAVMISVPHETDGVTNGYIMGLLLTPPDIITPEYKRLLNAGGIYFEGDPWQTYAEYKADPNNLDNYQYIARDSRQYLGNMKREALAPIPANDAKSVKRMKYIRRGISVVGRSNLVPDQAELAKGHKVGRDWAKQPLLEASYGAGAAAIIRSMISDATDTFHTLLAKSNADLDIAIEEALARDDQEAADALEATRAQVTADAMSNAYETVNMVIKAHQQAGIKRYAGKDELGRKLWENYETMATDNPSGRLLAEDVIGLAKAQFGGDIRRMSQEFRLSKEAQRLLEGS